MGLDSVLDNLYLGSCFPREVGRDDLLISITTWCLLLALRSQSCSFPGACFCKTRLRAGSFLQPQPRD